MLSTLFALGRYNLRPTAVLPTETRIYLLFVITESYKRENKKNDVIFRTLNGGGCACFWVFYKSSTEQQSKLNCLYTAVIGYKYNKSAPIQSTEDSGTPS